MTSEALLPKLCCSALAAQAHLTMFNISTSITRTVKGIHFPATLHLDQLWLSSGVRLLFGALANKHSGEQCTPHC